MPSLALVLLVGAAVGFTGGLLGKGGSAVATPLLVAIGIPLIIAVAAPLPATIPGTLIAADRYRRSQLVDGRVLWWSVVAGGPATVAGALATRWVDAGAIVRVTDLVLVALGLRLLAHRVPTVAHVAPPGVRRTVAVGVVVGLVSGLLANSGGFLLAPLFIAVLDLPVKSALGTSLAVAGALAVPGSITHLMLGHLDWRVVVAFGLGSIPLARAGAVVALHADAHRLERLYGAVLVLLGGGFLLLG